MVMNDLKIKQMDDVSKLHINLQGAIIELVEEGYSEVEIKKYLDTKFKVAQNFLEEYLKELDNPGMFIDNEEWEKEMGR
jgi:hypothetical protein